MFHLQQRLCVHTAILLCLLETTLAEESCGRVRGHFELSQDMFACVLTFTPSAFFTSNIKPPNYRWMKRANAYEKISPSERPDEFSSGKYAIQNDTLRIANVDEADEGEYMLECWIAGGVAERSVSWFLNIPAATPAATPTDSAVTAGESTDPPSSPDSTAIIVVAVCAVTVVAIIACTVIIILRNKDKPTDGNRILVSYDEQSTQENGNTSDCISGAMYADIDNMRMLAGDGNQGTESFHGSRLDILCYDESPSLPKRPDKLNKSNDSASVDLTLDADDAYATIGAADTDTSTEVDTKQREATVTQANSNGNKETVEYAIAIPKAERQRTNGLHDSELNAQYARPIPKSQRSSNANAKLQTCHNNDNPNSHTPSNANVSDNTDSVDASTRSGAPSSTYSVAFPSIDCGSMATLLPETDSGSNNTHQDSNATSIQSPTYSNLVTRQRRSSRKQRVKSRELQYACLDHVVTDMHYATIGITPTTEDVQYASIDFEKKAFVAPLRKAPSSWYKRKLKKKKAKD